MSQHHQSNSPLTELSTMLAAACEVVCDCVEMWSESNLPINLLPVSTSIVKADDGSFGIQFKIEDIVIGTIVSPIFRPGEHDVEDKLCEWLMNNLDIPTDL